MNYGDAKALPQNIIDAMSADDRKALGVKSIEERMADADTKSEREIQNLVEAYLIQLGYERRTPENIGRGMPRSGWFIHLVKTKRNPILLDLLILSHSGRYIELELKTERGKIRPEQEALIAQGGLLARNTTEAMGKILEWHEDVLKHTYSKSDRIEDDQTIRHDSKNW